jgi:hypothetical protein
MTKTAPQPRTPSPAWQAEPGWRVTLTGATPGEVRTDAGGTQWSYDANHGWQPVIITGEREADREAGG